MTPQEMTIACVVVTVALIMASLLVCSLLRDVDLLERRERERDQRIQAELDALRAASRINLDYWNTRQAMRAEAERYLPSGDRPW